MSDEKPARRFTEWDVMERIGLDGQADRTQHRAPDERNVTYLPRLDRRPGQRN